MKAYILVKAHVGEITPVIRRLKAVEGVVQVHGTFGPWDAVLTLEADELAHLGTIVYDEIQTTAGVERTMTLPVVCC